MWNKLSTNPPKFDYIGQQKKVVFASKGGAIWFGLVDNTLHGYLRWMEYRPEESGYVTFEHPKFIEFWMEIPEVPKSSD